MKRILISGLALCAMAAGALAQAAPPPPGAPPARSGMRAPPPPPPGGPDVADDAGGPPPPPRGGPGGHRPPPPPPPSKAAHFRIERGDVRLDAKCADDEPMRACADITLQLLDKLQAMPPAPRTPPAP